MALIAESKGFYAPDDDGTQVENLTSSVWGSEAPKTHFLFGMGQSAASVSTDMKNSIGWSDGTDNVAIGNGSQNGQGTSVCNRTHQTAYTAYPLTNNGGIYERAVQSSYSNTPVVGHTWSSSANDGYYYYLMALGGSDVENISFDVISTKIGTTGDVSYTGPGFEPDFLLAFSSAAHTVGLPYAAVHSVQGFGFSDGTTHASNYNASLDAQVASNTYSVHSDNFLHITASDGSNYATATVKSLDSGGYTLTYGDVHASVGFYYTIIAIKGPQAKVAHALQAASNTTSDVSTATYSTGTATVKPNADGSVTGTWGIVGGAGSRHASVSHGTSSPDDTEYVQNLMDEGDTNEHMYLGFENMPGDFLRASAGTVTLKIRQKGHDNDDDDVSYQLFASNGTTALSDKITREISRPSVDTSFRTDTVSFTLTGATDKTSWDGALIKIIHQGPGDGEDPEYYVSEIQLEIPYITTTVTDSGFVPKAGICLGAMKTDSQGSTSNNRFTIGTWDAQDNMDAGGFMDENGQSTTDVDRYISGSYSIVNYNHAQTVVGQAAVAANGNGIRETWSSTDGTQYAHSWLLLGDAPASEIVVTGLDDEDIADGDSSPRTADGTDFGTITVGDSAVTRTFKVTNTGGATLTLGATPSVPTGFTVTEGLTTSLAAGANDTFSVRLDNSVVGTKSGDVSITNNDDDENPFNFAITGEVSAAAAAASPIVPVTNALLRPSFAGL
jgi:hypothetical protein